MILIKNGKILTRRGVVEGNLLIEENRISMIGDAWDKSDIVIEADGKAVIPGLVNCHTHAAMVLFRGYADDMYLHEWLQEKIWPLERKLTERAVYWGTKLACIEMLKSGTTFFNDMYFFPESVARAVEETGIRACISSAFFDFFNPGLLEEALSRAEKEIRALGNYERVIPAIGPHAVYTVSLDGLAGSMDLAKKYNAFVHFHLAETREEILEFEKRYGKGIVRALDEIGFLNDRLIAAHSVWLKDDEIDLLAKRGVSVVHCPTSNMKLCVGGVLNFREMKRRNLNVTLGTDGAASNNNLDMLEEMKFASLLQKFYYGDPTIMKAEEVFAMATKNASKAFKLDLGMVEEGYLADLAIVDLKKVFMRPSHNLVADLVYSASGCCVDTVIVDGKVVIKNGHHKQEEEIIERATEVARDLVNIE